MSGGQHHHPLKASLNPDLIQWLAGPTYKDLNARLETHQAGAHFKALDKDILKMKLTEMTATK